MTDHRYHSPPCGLALHTQCCAAGPCDLFFFTHCSQTRKSSDYQHAGLLSRLAIPHHQGRQCNLSYLIHSDYCTSSPGSGTMASIYTSIWDPRRPTLASFVVPTCIPPTHDGTATNAATFSRLKRDAVWALGSIQYDFMCYLITACLLLLSQPLWIPTKG